MQGAPRPAVITMSLSSARGNWKLSNSEPNLPLPPLTQDFTSVFEGRPPSPTDEAGDLARRMQRRRNSLSMDIPADLLSQAHQISDEEPLWPFEDSIDDSFHTLADSDEGETNHVVIRDLSSDEGPNERGRSSLRPVDGRSSSSLPTSPERPKKSISLQAPLREFQSTHLLDVVRAFG
jgi:hypothetical protein